MSLDLLSKPAPDSRFPEPRSPDSRSTVVDHPAVRRLPAPSIPEPKARRQLPPPIAADQTTVIAPASPRVQMEIVAGVLRGIDGIAAIAAGLAALALATPDLPLPASYYMLVSLFGALAVINLLHLCGAYRIDRADHVYRALGRVLLAWGVAAAAVTGALLAGGTTLEANATWLSLWATFGLTPALLARGICAVLVDHWRQTKQLQKRVAIVGGGPLGLRLLRRLSREGNADIIVTGIYDDRLSRLPDSCMGHKICGSVDDLVEDIRRQGIDTVIVALPLSAERRMADVMTKLRRVAVDVCLCPDQYGLHMDRVETERLGGVTLLNAERRPLRTWRGVVKEIEDRVFAGAILVLIAPLLATIALLIKLDSPGPVFFRQKRYGLNNGLIEVWKFRTMYDHASDPNAEQLTRRNDPRVTRLGAFLRRTSLDELPQFINVLRGEMSVVGPRPHATAAKAGGLLYQDAVANYDSRHRMKPGITGWAQVNGWRGETETVEQIVRRVEHDLHYVENWSVKLDVLIILRTVFGGFTGRQAY